MVLKPPDIAAIAYLAKAGHKPTYISNTTGISLRSCERWSKKFRDNNYEDLPLPSKHPGKARLVSPRGVSILGRDVEKNPRITAKQLKDQNPDILGNVSLNTVRRILRRDLNYKYRCAWKKPILTNRQIKNRVKFAKDNKDWTPARCKRVLWSDEFTVTVTSNRPGKIRRCPGSDPLDPKYLAGTTKFPDKLMIWGCFSYYGVGKLIVLPKNESVNKESYLELLNDHLDDCFLMCRVPYSTGTFMQDGASCHTAKVIKEWFDFVNIDYIKNWPGNSPDLNPIENLWAIIKSKLKGRDTSSVPKLEAAVRDIWNNLDKSTLQNLALSVPDRFKEVIARKGRPTKY